MSVLSDPTAFYHKLLDTTNQHLHRKFELVEKFSIPELKDAIFLANYDLRLLREGRTREAETGGTLDQFLGILLRKRASMLVVPFSETEEE